VEVERRNAAQGPLYEGYDAEAFYRMELLRYAERCSWRAFYALTGMLGGSTPPSA
jgi:hypothetical protein